MREANAESLGRSDAPAPGADRQGPDAGEGQVVAALRASDAASHMPGADIAAGGGV